MCIKDKSLTTVNFQDILVSIYIIWLGNPDLTPRLVQLF